MSRFATLSAGIAVMALVAMPATAQAQDRPRVDEKTGPVAFANPAALAVVDDGRGGKGGSVISETQRSPVVPGTSRLSDERSTVPQGDDEKNAVGPNYLVSLRNHDVTATLRDSHVPTATATADYELSYGPDGITVLAFDAATSTVECAAPDRLRADTTADELRVRDSDGKLTPVPLPEGDKPVTLTNLPFGPPVEIDGAGGKATSDVSIRRVTALDELLRQDAWRGGDVTAVGGWLVEIVSHVPPAGEGPESDRREPSASDGDATGEPGGETETTGAQRSGDGASSPEQSPSPESSDATGGGASGSSSTISDTTSDAEPIPGTTSPARTAGGARIAAADGLDITTRIVLGGVSCSLPSDFVPVSTDGAGNRPTVPVKIPAGVPAADTDVAGAAWGWGLLGGGVLLGASALLLARRRAPAIARAETAPGEGD